MRTSDRTAPLIAAVAAEAVGAPRPVRILHVVMRMDHGGIETSLVHLLRSIDRQRYQMDFLALHEQPGTQDDDVRALGSHIFVCGAHRRPWRMSAQFGRIMREAGPYDVVHSHVHFYGGYVLKLAARHGVPLRIAHSRNDTRKAEQRRGWARRPYVWLMRRWIRRYANVRVAVSHGAAEDLFAGDQAHCEIIRSGRDFSPYAAASDQSVRRELGLPDEVFVLGHVGRFYVRKNHPFVVSVAAELFRRDPNAHLLLIGDGPEQETIKALVRAEGIAERVVFAGSRDDVPRLLTGAIDALILPSFHEGLSMAVVEAQAAGLPCLVSDALTREMDVVPALVHRLPLAAPPHLWVDRLLEAICSRKLNANEALKTVMSSEFSIKTSVERHRQIYARALSRERG